MAEQRIELPVVGMTCANCARAVERTLTRKVPGVISANVNFGTETASVEYDPQATSLEAMAETVHNAGYELVLTAAGAQDVGQDAEQEARQRELAAQQRYFWVGVAFTLPLFVLSMSRDFRPAG